MQGLLCRPHLRPLAVYLLVTAGPNLVLLYLGLQSVQRQRQAIDSLAGCSTAPWLSICSPTFPVAPGN